MDNNEPQELKKINVRGASNFGFQLATSLAERLSNEDVPPSEWPIRFPLTLKQIAKTPEVNGNNKIAKKVSEAARVIWKDMREHAIDVEKDMKLHPEYYQDIDIGADIETSHTNYLQDNAWRHLSIEIEQIAGHVFVTEYTDEDSAKSSVYLSLSMSRLKKYIIDFEEDYKAFIEEIRKAIRNKKIPASSKLELICLINTNTKSAIKSIAKQKQVA